jgi:hypothetical protein
VTTSHGATAPAPSALIDARGFVRPLERGQYDLVNISLIGRDPITGRSYEACSAELSAAATTIAKEAEGLRWWHLYRQFRLRVNLVRLYQRQGAPPGFLA